MAVPGRSRVRPVLATALALVLAACSAPAPTGPDPRPTTAQASTAQVDYQRLRDSIEGAIGSGSVALDTIGAVLVSHDGQTVLTDYRNGRDPGRAMHVYSVTKSVLSALVGIALDEKVIDDLDAPLPDLLPRYRERLRGDLARVTLRQLMSMSAGFGEDDSTPSVFADALQSDGDTVGYILERGLADTPGESFVYSNRSAHLVSAVLTESLARADGPDPRTVLDYANEKLFEPLGIDTRHPYTARFRPDRPAPFERAGFGWATDAQGIMIGAGGLRLRPADLLKLGQVYLDQGRWQGRQLVPEQWVTQSVAPSPASSQYGLMWWRETTPGGGPAYAARGFGGQLLVVVPEHRLVVVVAAQPGRDVATDSDAVFALVSQVILAQFG